MMGLEPVREALRFIEEDQPNAIGEQKELVVIEVLCTDEPDGQKALP